MSVKNTFAAILGAVATTANAGSKLIESTAKSVDILDAAVEKFKTEQMREYAVDLEAHKRQYLMSAAKKDDEFKREIQKYRAQSATHAAGFDESLAALSAALDAAMQGKAVA